jgi:SAM-dependent methyltransferase
MGPLTTCTSEIKSFDVAMAISTIHHWRDRAAGLREMRRVTHEPIVLLTFDPSHGPWLTNYLPELVTLDARQMPKMSLYAEWLTSVTIGPDLVPHDCTDGFLYASWCWPEAYLDQRIRSGSSSFWSLQGLEQGLARLSHDSENCRMILIPDIGTPSTDFFAISRIQCGYRLVIGRLC